MEGSPVFLGLSNPSVLFLVQAVSFFGTIPSSLPYNAPTGESCTAILSTPFPSEAVDQKDPRQALRITNGPVGDHLHDT